MMKALARFLLSLELLFSHPGKWWREQAWLIKTLWFLLLMAAINGGSLWFYQKWMVRPSQPVFQTNGRADQEIGDLRRQIVELKGKQDSLLDRLAEKDRPASAAAAGSPERNQTGIGGGVIPELAEEESDAWASESARIVFLPATKAETTSLYKQPDAKGTVLTTIPTDTWYLIVNKRNGWYQIEVDEDGRIGWIPSAVAVEQGLE
jgi:hypothetical protein